MYSLNISPVGIKSIDEVLGGGVVKNGKIELWGDEQSGKTGTAMSCARSFDHVFFYDIDGTFPQELEKLILHDHPSFNVIGLLSDKDWIRTLNT